MSVLASPLVPALRDLIHELVVGNYAGLEANGRAGRLTAEELNRAIIEYGCVLIDPPDQAFEIAEAYPVRDRLASWMVEIDLWTVEEGRSDLTLSVEASITPDGVQTKISDLHVL